MELQKKEIEKMMRRGGNDPWAVDFNEKYAGKDLTNPDDTMKEVAQTYTDNPSPSSLGAKSFSF